MRTAFLQNPSRHSMYACRNRGGVEMSCRSAASLCLLCRQHRATKVANKSEKMESKSERNNLRGRIFPTAGNSVPDGWEFCSRRLGTEFPDGWEVSVYRLSWLLLVSCFHVISRINCWKLLINEYCRISKKGVPLHRNLHIRNNRWRIFTCPSRFAKGFAHPNRYAGAMSSSHYSCPCRELSI